MAESTRWASAPLTEVLDFREGPGILAKDFHETGVPLIRLAGVKRGANILDGCNFLDPALVERKWSHFRLRRGDVLLSTSASLGEVAVVDDEGVGAVPYTGLIGFRPRGDRVSPRFVPIALTSRSFKVQIEAMGVGSVMKHFGPMHLRQMSIEVPPLDVQEGIADVVEVLDDKIAANTKLATTATDLAGSLVQAAVAHSSESRPIADIAEFHNRRRVPLSSREREQRVGEVPYYGANGQVDAVDDFLFKGEYVLAGEDGTVITGDGRPVARFIWGPAWVNNHAHVMSGSTVSTPLLFHLVRSAKIEAAVTGAVQPKLSMTNFKGVTVAVPSGDRLSQLDQKVCALMAKYQSISDESSRLASIRDTLLPALMSGKLRVEGAAEVAGL